MADIDTARVRAAAWEAHVDENLTHWVDDAMEQIQAMTDSADDEAAVQTQVEEALDIIEQAPVTPNPIR